MPDLLGPTKPVPGYDSTGARASQILPNDTSIRNLTDPARVTRPDGRTQGQDAGDHGASGRVRYESNFLSFLQRLRQTPQVGEEWNGLLRLASEGAAFGVSEEMAAELSRLVDFLPVDERTLMAFLQNQIKSGARFGGALFQLLRMAYANTRSQESKLDILQFLRRYSDYSSTPHLEERICGTLVEMSRALPTRWREGLLSIAAQFENGAAAGDRRGNLALLRDKAFPLMAGYVGNTHDHGRARSLLSILTLDMVRYENGDEFGLLQAFHRLGLDGVFPDELRRLPDGDILEMLRDSEWFKASNNDPFADRLAELAGRALRGEGGAGAQEAFRAMLSSVLINESVYMPLNHIILPLEWNGRSAYSELWVDPDGEREQGGAGGRTTRILIRMEVQDLGAFDVLLNAGRQEVAVQVACPEGVSLFSEEVTGALKEILRRNGFEPGAVRVTPRRAPITLLEAFPNLVQRTDGVDVKI